MLVMPAEGYSTRMTVDDRLRVELRGQEEIATSPARTPSKDHSGRDKKSSLLRVVLTEERLHLGLYLLLRDL